MQATVETLQEQAATSYFVGACREWVSWSSVCPLQLSYIQRATSRTPGFSNKTVSHMSRRMRSHGARAGASEYTSASECTFPFPSAK